MFIFSSVLITSSGVIGWFDKLMRLIPKPLASVMLAGILFQFGLSLFKGLETDSVRHTFCTSAHDPVYQKFIHG